MVGPGDVVRFADVAVGLGAPDPERLRLLRGVVARLQPAHVAPGAVLRIVEPAPTVPSRSPDFAEHQTSFWVEGDELVIAVAGVVARASDTGADIGGVGATDAGLVRRLLLPAMTHVFAVRDRFVLHAGAARSSSGSTVGFTGASGSGKSTVAFAARCAGWTVLADDMVIVRGGSSRLEAAGVPQEFAVPAELVPSNERHRLGLTPHAGDARGRLLVHDRMIDTSWHPLSALVFVAHGAATDGELVAIDAAQAMPTVLSSFTSVLAAGRLRRFLPIAGELARLPTWELRLARDPRHRMAAVQRHLSVIVGDRAT